MNHHPSITHMSASSCIGGRGSLLIAHGSCHFTPWSGFYRQFIVVHQHDVSAGHLLFHCFPVSVSLLCWNCSLPRGLWRHGSQAASGLTFSGTNLWPESKGSILRFALQLSFDVSISFPTFFSPLTACESPPCSRHLDDDRWARTGVECSLLFLSVLRSDASRSSCSDSEFVATTELGTGDVKVSIDSKAEQSFDDRDQRTCHSTTKGSDGGGAAPAVPWCTAGHSKVSLWNSSDCLRVKLIGLVRRCSTNT